MGSLEYTRVLERQTGFPGRLFVLETEQAIIAYPFFVRPIKDLPFADELAGYWDTVTAEYSGPLVIPVGSHPDPSAAGFADHFTRYCRENGIIAEFAHLSPWHDSRHLLDWPSIEANREIVQLDLTLGEEGLWTKSLCSDTRRQTRQAEKAGVRVRWAESLDDVYQFYRLHAKTMERRSAREDYRLPPEYFFSIFETMSANAFFALAEYRNQVIAGGLYFHCGADVYWHLSALDMDFHRLRPVNKYVWETILWAVGAGKKRMLFGGGKDQNDGVLRFKAGFSPLRALFSIYRRTHDNAIYQTLTDAWSAYYQTPPRTDFFPAYRAAPNL